MEGGNVGMDGGNRKGETWLGRKESKKKGTMRSRKENANICRRVRELEIKEQREEREKRRFSGQKGEGMKWRWKFGTGGKGRGNKRRGKRESEYKESQTDKNQRRRGNGNGGNKQLVEKRIFIDDDWTKEEKGI